MDSNNELKEFDIKNHTCYYFDDIIEIENFNFGNILIDEKTHRKEIFQFITCRTKP